MARKASSNLWVKTLIFKVEVRHTKHCFQGAPELFLVEIETEQQIAERATQTMLLLDSKIDLIISELKLTCAYLELSEIDDDWKSYRLYKQQKLEKSEELGRFEELKNALISDPRSYGVIGVNLLPTSGED